MTATGGPAKLLTRLGGIVLFLLAWQALTVTGAIPPAYFPPLQVVAGAFVALVTSPTFLAHLAVTCERLALGLSIAVVLGTGLAFTTGYFRWVHRMLNPLVQMMRSLPPPALVPMAVLVIGLGLQLFLFVIVFGCIWAIYVNGANALVTSEPLQVYSARSLGYTEWEIFWHVRVPQALPEIVTGIRLAAGIALLATVASEMLAGESGLGYLLYNAGFTLQAPQMFAIMFIVGTLGVFLNVLVFALGKPLVGWQSKWAAQGDTA